jgi:hypothetical protein
MPRPPAARRRRLGGILLDTGPLGRHRDFRRLWAGQLVSQLGSQLLLTCWLLPGIWRYDARSHADPALTAAG